MIKIIFRLKFRDQMIYTLELDIPTPSVLINGMIIELDNNVAIPFNARNLRYDITTDEMCYIEIKNHFVVSDVEKEAARLKLAGFVVK